VTEPMYSGSSGSSGSPAHRSGSSGPGNLGDILERVLDRGIVITGDIRVNLLDIELLTIKLRLLIASVDTARQLGIDWWEDDPWLRSGRRSLEEENDRLRERVSELEDGRSNTGRELEAGGSSGRGEADSGHDDRRKGSPSARERDD
jgi:hypothetical protein